MKSGSSKDLVILADDLQEEMIDESDEIFLAVFKAPLTSVRTRRMEAQARCR